MSGIQVGSNTSREDESLDYDVIEPRTRQIPLLAYSYHIIEALMISDFKEFQKEVSLVSSHS